MRIPNAVLVYRRRARAYVWKSKNPVLLTEEEGIKTDTGLLKIGDGSTRWNDLPYLKAALSIQSDPEHQGFYQIK